MSEGGGILQKQLWHLGVLLGVSALLFFVLQPFILTIFFAIVLAIALHPLFIFLKRHVVRETLASLLTILIALVGAGVPLYFIAAQVAEESIAVYQRVGAGTLSFSDITEHPTSQRLTHLLGFSPEDITSGLG